MWQYERDRENEIRTVQQDGEPWFVLKDVCGLLGLTDIGRTAKRLDSDELTRDYNGEQGIDDSSERYVAERREKHDKVRHKIYRLYLQAHDVRQ